MFETLLFILGLSLGLIIGASHAYRDMNRKLKNMADHRLVRPRLWILITRARWAVAAADEIERLAKERDEARELANQIGGMNYWPKRS